MKLLNIILFCSICLLLVSCYTRPYVYEDRVTYDYHWLWIDRAPIYYPRPHVNRRPEIYKPHPPVVTKEKEKSKPREEKRESGNRRN